MEKINFEEPTIEVVEFESSDVITGSEEPEPQPP